MLTELKKTRKMQFHQKVSIKREIIKRNQIEIVEIRSTVSEIKKLTRGIQQPI